MKTENTEVLGR